MGQHHSPSKKLRLKLSKGATVGLIGIFGLVATGCSTTGTSTPHTNLIRIWRVGQAVDSFRDTITQFQKDHTATKVSYQNRTIDNYEFASLKSLAGRQGPDIWSIPNDWIGDYQDQVQPLPDDFFSQVTGSPKPVDEVKKLYPVGISSQIISADGTHVYGLPTNVDTLRLYVNQDVFSQALQDYRKSLGTNFSDALYQPVRLLLNNPPATWDDVVNDVKYITIRNGNTITRSAIALGTADNIPNAQDTLELLISQNGAKIVSDDHKNPLFHVPTTTPSGGQVRPGENALSFFSSFSDPSKATYSWNPSMPDALDAFAQGKLAMVVAYSDFGQKLKVKYPHFSPQISPVPQVSVSQTPVNWIRFSLETVTKTADNPAAAFAFMKLYTNQAMAKGLASELKLKSPFAATLDQNSSSDFLSKQILTGKTTYKLGHTQFDQTFHQTIVNVSQNGISPADAIKTAADQIDTLLNPVAVPTS
ncbi:MAG: extracellular solute-binding protein [bacterium]